MITAMKNQTFGVEVEMNNIRRDAAAKIAADYFGTQRFQDTACRNGYFTWSAWDAQGREWKFQKDVSIDGPDAYKCEMVTPILMYNDIPMLQEVLRRLRHVGAKSDATRGCGIHIHVGAQGHTPQTIRSLINIMASHEAILTEALRLDAYRLNQYCKPVDPKLVKAVNERKPKTMADLADIWYKENGADYGRNQHYNRSRYHMLNLHATFTKGTIEFRLFQFNKPGRHFKGGIHAGMIKSYIQLCLAMSQRAKEVKRASEKPVQMENKKYAMRCWLVCKLGMIGDEFKTARDILTRNLTGDAAYRNGRAA